MLDLCRTTPGLVAAVEGDSPAGRAAAAALERPRLGLGAWTTREVRWRDDGLAMLDAPSPGEWVSLHWDVACDRLTPRGGAALDRATRQALRAVDASSSAVAALA